MKAMLTDVLEAVTAAGAIERVIVVTGEGRAERIALARARRVETPIEVLRDPDDRGHSGRDAGDHPRALTRRRGRRPAAGRLPLLDPAELDARTRRGCGPGRVGVVPDRHGTGTNALLLAPADAIGPASAAGSAERHRDRPSGPGYAAEIERLASLALDLDTPDDLDVLPRCSPTPGARPGDRRGAAGAGPIDAGRGNELRNRDRPSAATRDRPGDASAR